MGMNRRAVPLMGIFGAVTWITLGFLWLCLAAEAPSYSTYSVSLLFNGFGIMLIVLVLIDLFKFGRSKRLLDDEVDEGW